MKRMMSMIVVKKMLHVFKLKKGKESSCGGKGNRRKRKPPDLLSRSFYVKPFRTYRKPTKELC